MLRACCASPYITARTHLIPQQSPLIGVAEAVIKSYDFDVFFPLKSRLVTQCYGLFCQDGEAANFPTTTDGALTSDVVTEASDIRKRAVC